MELTNSIKPNENEYDMCAVIGSRPTDGAELQLYIGEFSDIVIFRFSAVFQLPDSWPTLQGRK
jgi:hypothetical protein